jgi:L-amino acid N-acyltransferase YncA
MRFEELQQKHRKQVMAIFNYYIKNGTAAFPPEELPEAFFEKILEIVDDYPAYCLVDNENTIGFGFISAYKPFPI